MAAAETSLTEPSGRTGGEFLPSPPIAAGETEEGDCLREGEMGEGSLSEHSQRGSQRPYPGRVQAKGMVR